MPLACLAFCIFATCLLHILPLAFCTLPSRQLVTLKELPNDIVGVDGGGRVIGGDATFNTPRPGMPPVVGKIKLDGAVGAIAPFGERIIGESVDRFAS